MKFSLLLFFILNGLYGFSQWGDTYQPAAIYKQNNVRSRILMYDYNRYRTRVVDNFDHNGLVIEHIEYDTTGVRCRTRSEMQYDSNLNLISETSFSYFHFDSLTKKAVLTAIPDTIKIIFEHDDKGRIIKKTHVNAAGKIFYERIYSFEPFMVTERSFNKDSINLEIILYYDVLYIEKRSFSTFHYPDGRIRKWNYTYKNKFDRFGKIKRRSVKGEFYPEDPDKPDIYFREQDYQYTSTGLLIKRMSTDCNDNSTRRFSVVFDYEFW